MQFINKALGLVGLRLTRSQSAHETTLSDVVMKIGGLALVVPGGSPLQSIYRNTPGYMSELGRVAAATYGKYPSMIVVDVGANIGDTAAIVRSVCSAPIVCVEGDQSHDRILAENASIIGNVQVKYQYLSDTSHSERVVLNKEGWNSTIVPSRSAEGRIVSFLTLDDTLSDVEIERIKLVKIDAEGFDPRIIRGAKGILETSSPVVMFEHNRENLSKIDEDDVSSFVQLRHAGYRDVLVWDASGRFLLGSTLECHDLIEDLHGYVDFDAKHRRHLSKVLYLDVCVFHERDRDIAARCVAAERQRRRSG